MPVWSRRRPRLPAISGQTSLLQTSPLEWTVRCCHRLPELAKELERYVRVSTSWGPLHYSRRSLQLLTRRGNVVRRRSAKAPR